MSNKKLIIVFVALLAIYLLSRVFLGKKQSTYDPQIIAVDTAAVTEIHLYPKAENGVLVTLKRTDAGWTASRNDKTVGTPGQKLAGLMSQLTGIRSERIVSRSPESWQEYEVDDSGSRVEVYAGKKKIADFIVGTFKFDQVKRSASSYVRTAEKDEVYLVDGFMSMTFNQGFNTFRDNSLIKLNAEDIREVTVRQQDGAALVSKNPEDGMWYRNGMELLDSAQVAQFLTSMANVSGSEFVEGPVSGSPQKSLEINGNNLVKPITVDCFFRQDSVHPFVFRSSLNPDALFGSDSAGLFQRIFVKFDDILRVKE